MPAATANAIAAKGPSIGDGFNQHHLLRRDRPSGWPSGPKSLIGFTSNFSFRVSTRFREASRGANSCDVPLLFRFRWD